MILQLLATLAIQAAADVPTPAAAPATSAPARKALTLRRYDGQASQGAAAGPSDVYSISNFKLVRLDKKTGEKRAEWVGEKARFPHINSCAVIAKDLVCASSNYPGVPHVSTVEVFDP